MEVEIILEYYRPDCIFLREGRLYKLNKLKEKLEKFDCIKVSIKQKNGVLKY